MIFPLKLHLLCRNSMKFHCHGSLPPFQLPRFLVKSLSSWCSNSNGPPCTKNLDHFSIESHRNLRQPHKASYIRVTINALMVVLRCALIPMMYLAVGNLWLHRWESSSIDFLSGGAKSRSQSVGLDSVRTQITIGFLHVCHTYKYNYIYIIIYIYIYYS